MIRLAEEKDFLQLAEMKWEHSAEDDITYGETNIVGIDKQGFINEYIPFLFWNEMMLLFQQCMLQLLIKYRSRK